MSDAATNIVDLASVRDAGPPKLEVRDLVKTRRSTTGHRAHRGRPRVVPGARGRVRLPAGSVGQRQDLDPQHPGRARTPDVGVGVARRHADHRPRARPRGVVPRAGVVPVAVGGRQRRARAEVDRRPRRPATRTRQRPGSPTSVSSVSPTSSRTSCRPACGSGRHSRAPSRANPMCCWATSPSARSTRRRANSFRTRSSACGWERDGRTTFVFVTHNVREAALLADRVLVLSAAPGKLIEEVRIDAPRPRQLDDVLVARVVSEVHELLMREVEQGGEPVKRIWDEIGPPVFGIVGAHRGVGDRGGPHRHPRRALPRRGVERLPHRHARRHDPRGHGQDAAPTGCSRSRARSRSAWRSGWGMALNEFARRSVRPLIVALQITPFVAWLPLAVIWFGASERAVVFVTIVGAFPSVTLATMSAIRQVPPILHPGGTDDGRRRLGRCTGRDPARGHARASSLGCSRRGASRGRP